MIEKIIDNNSAGQRLDKYLKKLLPDMPVNLMYKQLRNKNITINGHKSDGSEIIVSGDVLRLFLADKTYSKFAGETNSSSFNAGEEEYIRECINVYHKYKDICRIVFENEHIIVIDKPAGMLTQRSRREDTSLNEFLLGYLMFHSIIDRKDYKLHHPSAMNRLDRNTSGLVLCSKTSHGAIFLSSVIKSGSIQKLYHGYFVGTITGTLDCYDYLEKDESGNKVNIVSVHEYEGLTDREKSNFVPVHTMIKPIRSFKYKGADITYGEIRLYTGKSHQIRAHGAGKGFPLWGDPKYGNARVNRLLPKGSTQLLHAYMVKFSPEVIWEDMTEPKGLIIESKEPYYYGNME